MRGEGNRDEEAPGRAEETDGRIGEGGIVAQKSGLRAQLHPDADER